MEQQAALSSICRLPATFYGGGKSFAQIVRDSGVSKAQLTAKALQPILQAEPSLVEGWLLWSMNKRVSSGWFFQQKGSSYIVGFHPAGERFLFQDATAGCAEFIVREVRAANAL